MLIIVAACAIHETVPDRTAWRHALRLKIAVLRHLAYLAFSLPAVMAGVAVTRYGPRDTAYV